MPSGYYMAFSGKIRLYANFGQNPTKNKKSVGQLTKDIRQVLDNSLFYMKCVVKNMTICLFPSKIDTRKRECP